jgi:hypothetical protein
MILTKERRGEGRRGGEEYGKGREKKKTIEEEEEEEGRRK